MSPRYVNEIELQVPVEAAFTWHERTGAFERLLPPWDDARVIQASEGIKDGQRLIFDIRVAPALWVRWEALHSDYHWNQRFKDTQVRGPFKQWDHLHLFQAVGETRCTLRDEVEYQFPFEGLARLAPTSLTLGRIQRSFHYRNRVLKREIELHHRTALPPRRILISGATGLVGSSLRTFLTSGGHTVVPLVRRPVPGTDGLYWNPSQGFAPEQLHALEGFHAVVHLAGESVMGIWTAEKRRRIRNSRVLGTRHLCQALAKLDRKPEVLICASAIGYYGNRGDELITEGSEPGEGFLAGVCREWEDACEPARSAGIRVVNLRLGVVLTPKGGALRAMLPAFRAGLAGRLGSGQQFMSWISHDDAVQAIHHAIVDSSLEGSVNATAPEPVTNAEFTRTLARVLHRFSGPPAPAALLRLAGSEFAQAFFLDSARVQPMALETSGYRFAYPSLEEALRHLLGR